MSGSSPRQIAIQAGAKTYFTGRPCSRGHVAPRQTSNQTCTECRRADVAAWFAANPERLAEFREASKPLQRAKMREYRQSHPEILNERTRQWRKNNPDKRRANEQARRARKRGAEGHYTPADLDRISKLQKGKCAICKCASRKLTPDHIVPLKRGGSNWPRNIQMACLPCNQRKHAKDPIEFMREMGALL